MGIIFHNVWHILLVRNNSQYMTSFKERELYTKARVPEDRIILRSVHHNCELWSDIISLFSLLISDYGQSELLIK